MSAPACPNCGAVLGPDGRCSSCSATAARNPTIMVPVTEPGGRFAVPEPAGDDLARVPLPAGWEVSLDVLEGPQTGLTFRITRSRVLIGRGNVEIALDDPRVSRRHASLEVYGSTCILLKDLGSTNGTFVNGRRAGSCELQDGDEIRIGGTRMTITIGAPP